MEPVSRTLDVIEVESQWELRDEELDRSDAAGPTSYCNTMPNPPFSPCATATARKDGDD